MLVKNNPVYLFLLLLVSCVHVNNDASTASADSLKKKMPAQWHTEDEFYSTFFLQNDHLAITNQRPSKSDTSVIFCVAGAFTQLQNDSIDGLYVLNGTVVNPKVNHHLGGGLLIVNNTVSIIGTDDGKLLTQHFTDSIAALKASFFQQIQLVRNGEALPFHKDRKLFERRAIILFLDGKIAVVESKNRITLDEFTEDLVKMGAKNALYIDMGSWDEGWYRNPGATGTVIIGRNRMDTQRQSNWVIFRK